MKATRQSDWIEIGREGDKSLLTCRAIGCKTTRTVQTGDLPPGPCWRPHVSGYGSHLIDDYQDVVATLRGQRHALGVTQEEINAWAGLADGHINKLEAGWRLARFPTIQHWAQSLGLQFALIPSPLPTIVANNIARKAGIR